MFLFVLFLPVVMVSAGPRPKILRSVVESQTKVSSLFVEQIKITGKQYDSTETAFRMKVFKTNLQSVVDCNERASYSCGVNKFTDLTPEERRQFLGLKNMTGRIERRVRPYSDKLKPLAFVEYWDWRDYGAVAEVKDQGACASCYVFSATGALEGAYQLATGVLKSFSEQELLDCTFELYDGYDGCTGGWFYQSWDYVRRARHLSTVADYPYVGSDNACNREATNGLTEGFIKNWVEIEAGDENLAAAIAIKPVSVGMIFEGTAFDYESGVYDGSTDCFGMEYGTTNHALVAVAYTPDSFTIKNSWGADWGENGYMRLVRGPNTCRLSDFVFYLEIRTTEDATEEPPTIEPTPGPDCRDSSPSCEDWARWGDCWDSFEYMVDSCPWSCHQCECGNFHEQCVQWAEEGECEANPNYMLVSCREACDACDEVEPTRDTNCEDLDSNCAAWAEEGGCEASPGYMLENCKESCGQCDNVQPTTQQPPTQQPDCEDLDSNCAAWAEEGGCEASPGYMLENCKDSCGQCDNVQPTTQQPPTQQPGGCKDTSSDCPARAAAGECYSAADWDAMFEECPKSCHQCECGDNHPTCPAWAAYDQCSLNPGWMGPQCRASCDQCAPQGCVDMDPECTTLAAAGQCYLGDWDQMFLLCPKSCHRCECGDNHPDCRAFADRGDCEAAAGWMLEHCQQACGVCTVNRLQ